jgi:hypothetical protein
MFGPTVDVWTRYDMQHHSDAVTTAAARVVEGMLDASEQGEKKLSNTHARAQADA